MYYSVLLVSGYSWEEMRKILYVYSSGKLQLDSWTLDRAGAEYLHHGHSPSNVVVAENICCITILDIKVSASQSK